MYGGGVVAVAGDADGPGQALVPGADQGLERAPGSRRLVELFERAHRVQLDQVDVIGLQALEARG